MKKFINLLKREHHDFKSWYMVYLLFSLAVLYILPSALIRFTSLIQTERELRTIFIGLFITFASLLAVIQYITSLNISVKQKDIWLHNTSSILTLIGAKLVYALIGVSCTVATLSIGFYFVPDLIDGTFIQKINLILLTLISVINAYLLFACVMTIVSAFSKQLGRYLGRFSVIITFIVCLFGLYIITPILEQDYLAYGHIHLDQLANYLPTTITSALTLTSLDFYVVQELAIFFALIACFVLGAKWIERVMTH